MFEDRVDAGRALAGLLQEYKGRKDIVVLALPRGGVPVGAEVARALDAPLDVLIVRKLGVPMQPELAMGAIASGGARHLNDELIEICGITPKQIENVVARETLELQRRERLYRGDRAPLEVRDRTLIVVDDGIATGASMIAAVSALRRLAPAAIVVAVPVAPPDTAAHLQDLVDRFVCVETPPNFRAVGQFYRRFDQTTDEEVRKLLA